MKKKKLQPRTVPVVIEVINVAPLQAYLAAWLQLMEAARLTFDGDTPYRKGQIDALEGVKEYIAAMDKMEAMLE